MSIDTPLDRRLTPNSPRRPSRQVEVLSIFLEKEELMFLTGRVFSIKIDVSQTSEAEHEMNNQEHDDAPGLEVSPGKRAQGLDQARPDDPDDIKQQLEPFMTALFDYADQLWLQEHNEDALRLYQQAYSIPAFMPSPVHQMRLEQGNPKSDRCSPGREVK